MIGYKKMYCKYFGYGEQDFIPCEITGNAMNSIHHIKSKGRGGKDNIENLMALRHDKHAMAHDEKLSEDYLQEIHNKFMKNNKV